MSSGRWSLSNLFFSIDYKQFMDLSTEFKAACEDAFGTPCSLEVLSPDIAEITKRDWDRAKYVDIKIVPQDKSKAPDYAFAGIEFKGKLRRTATYYIQGEKDAGFTREQIISRHRQSMSIGNGYADHVIKCSVPPP